MGNGAGVTNKQSYRLSPLIPILFTHLDLGINELTVGQAEQICQLMNKKVLMFVESAVRVGDVPYRFDYF